MILPELAHDEVIFDLFRREATTLSRLHHEAIVHYHVFSVEPVAASRWPTTSCVGGRVQQLRFARYLPCRDVPANP